ncbi:tRNA-intron lyase [Nitrosopumilus sp. b1]|uniref:tRNA-intron lyase n=1 Tax=Nitrosopumilus sp. b1 TaxID=2109907 RepID=UPI0021033931|nr:tRNA-intron lyase [Nitrosopumilus sp. b1]
MLISNIMDNDSEPNVEGMLIDDQTLISDSAMQHDLELKGYGDLTEKKFFLKPFEALYLLYSNKLKLHKGSKLVDFDTLMQICIKFDEDILTKFLIYRDLKTRGYTVKDGFGFGFDFRVYDRGHFGEKGAKYLVFGLNEGRQEKIGKLQQKVEEITQMGKEPIIAVVEKRGEVIYYKISKINFLENKERVSMNFS